MTLNVCQAGHASHASKLVDTQYGQWNIWDWERYMDFPNYCTGQDEVSKSIEVNGYWERADTDHFRQILTEQSGVVLDLGSHLGWFAVQAASLGCRVIAVDADPENRRLLLKNAMHRGVEDLIQTRLSWVVDLRFYEPDALRLMKVDIEGHEHEALDLTRHLWQRQKIDYGLWELSPIFENREGINAPSYADLVDEIASYGYRWYILKDEERWYIEGKDLTFPQENAWCQKI